MSNRTFEDSILWDEAVNSLSEKAFSHYFRMIMVADDYGILPADPETLGKLMMLTSAKFREIPRNSAELLEFGLIRPAEFLGRQVYVIKPESWDRAQRYHIQKRTKSKYLKERGEVVETFRTEVWSTPISQFEKKVAEIPRNSAKFRASRAKTLVNTTTISSPVCSEEQKREEVIEPVLNGHVATLPHSTGHHQTCLVTLIVDMLKKLGRDTGIPAYENISHITWEHKLRVKANEIGYQCLYRQAERFCNWFEGEVSSGRIRRDAKHNPPARFLNTWLGHTKPEEYTSNDELWHPDTHTTPAEDNPYQNLTS